MVTYKVVACIELRTQLVTANILTIVTMLSLVLTGAIYALFVFTRVDSKLTWATTDFLFTFGDSYTTDGFNISAGVNSPNPGFVRVFSSVNESAYMTHRHLQMGPIGSSSSVS